MAIDEKTQNQQAENDTDVEREQVSLKKEEGREENDKSEHAPHGKQHEPKDRTCKEETSRALQKIATRVAEPEEEGKGVHQTETNIELQQENLTSASEFSKTAAEGEKIECQPESGHQATILSAPDDHKNQLTETEIHQKYDQFCASSNQEAHTNEDAVSNLCYDDDLTNKTALYETVKAEVDVVTDDVNKDKQDESQKTVAACCSTSTGKSPDKKTSFSRIRKPSTFSSVLRKPLVTGSIGNKFTGATKASNSIANENDNISNTKIPTIPTAPATQKVPSKLKRKIVMKQPKKILKGTGTKEERLIIINFFRLNCLSFALSPMSEPFLFIMMLSPDY